MGCGSSSDSIQPARNVVDPQNRSISSSDVPRQAQNTSDYEGEKGATAKRNTPQQSTSKAKTTKENPNRLDSPKNKEPAPRPPRKKKKEIVPDNNIFFKIDDHALKAPIRLRASIKDLVNYLIQPTRNDLEKVRAFYRWITNNVSYDADSYFSGTVCDSSPAGVLLSGKSVCEGYARLFEEFCREADIPVKKISGYSKGYGWEAGDIITIERDTSHAWNAVFVSGEWRFIECTWGAGHLDDNGQFSGNFKEFYFLTDPEDFIIEHFPYIDKDMKASEIWQLLAKPLSLEGFCKNLHLYPTALELGLSPLTHSTETITVSGQEEIRFSYPTRNFEDFMLDLHKEKQKERKMNEYAMMEGLEESFVVIHLRLPESGSYFLTLYGKPKGRRSNELDALLIYKVVGKAITNKKEKYPIHNHIWGACFEFRECGFADQVSEKIMHTAHDGEFCISLATTRDIQIIASIEHAENKLKSEERYCLIRKQNNSLGITVRLPFVGFYKLSVYAKMPWSGNHDNQLALTYLIDCKSTAHKCPRFPVEYGVTQILHVQLLEPLNGELSANTKTKFRISAPTLKCVMVNKTMLDKHGDYFEGDVTTTNAGTKFSVYGSVESNGWFLQGLFGYDVV